MNARQLEARLAELGVPAAGLETITRVLRAQGLIPVGGRGPNAPQIGPAEASWMLAAAAAAPTPSSVASDLGRLLSLRVASDAPRHSNEFMDALQLILGSPEWAGEVLEIRVARNIDLARIVYSDGLIERFVAPAIRKGKQAEKLGAASFIEEGVLSRGLLSQVAIWFDERFSITPENVRAKISGAAEQEIA